MTFRFVGGVGCWKSMSVTDVGMGGGSIFWSVSCDSLRIGLPELAGVFDV